MANGHAKNADNNLTVPSRVVHFRGVPSDTTETEIIASGLQFGNVSNCLILKGKNQAFLEFESENSAISMVSFYNGGANQCFIRNKSCYIQYSTHKKLKTDDRNSNVVPHAQAAMKAVLPAILQYHSTAGSDGSAMIPGAAANRVSSSPNGDVLNGVSPPGGANTVLRAVIENRIYPVTLDVLNQIFSRYGKVLKIITFTKNNQFQALIQFPDRECAGNAKRSLDGINIYTNCCTLRIDYSRLSNLNVRYNNEKSRDYTNPQLPQGDMKHGESSLQHQINMQAAAALTGMNPQLLNQVGSSLFNASAAPGGPGGVGNVPGYNLGNLHILQALQSYQLQSMSGNGGPMPGGMAAPNGPVLLVSNLDEERVTPDDLAVLFGVYGDVLRVKILFNKKDSALIQMSEARHVRTAIANLDRVRLYGKPLKVTASKHPEVQLPKEGQQDAGLTKDYTHSPLHRFKRPFSKNYQNIYPPSPCLHLSNIPVDATEEEVKELFKAFDVVAFRFFPDMGMPRQTYRMALLQLSSLDEALEALIKMHNAQLREGTNLRVSFSKATIKD